MQTTMCDRPSRHNRLTTSVQDYPDLDCTVFSPLQFQYLENEYSWPFPKPNFLNPGSFRCRSRCCIGEWTGSLKVGVLGPVTPDVKKRHQSKSNVSCLPSLINTSAKFVAATAKQVWRWVCRSSSRRPDALLNSWQILSPGLRPHCVDTALVSNHQTP